MSVANQYFSAVDQLSDTFGSEVDDGILGLAYPSLSNMGQSPFVNSAKKQGALKAAEFAFKLAHDGSELYLGGTNSDLYSGSLEYHDVDTSTGFWQITGAKAYVGSTTANSGFETIIDSGTTLAYGPPSAIKTFYSKISGSGVYDSSQGYYYYPCDSPPTIAFSWGGKEWAISSAK